MKCYRCKRNNISFWKSLFITDGTASIDFDGSWTREFLCKECTVEFRMWIGGVQ